MSPTRNGNYQHGQHSATNSSNSSSTGTIPKVSSTLQGRGGRSSSSREQQVPPPGYSPSRTDFAASNPLMPDTTANLSGLDLAMLGQRGELNFEDMAGQNELLRRLREQQEKLRQLQRHQVEMLRWQESSRQMDESREVTPPEGASGRSWGGIATGAPTYLDGIMGRTESLPHPQQMAASLEQLQQRISLLRLIEADANSDILPEQSTAVNMDTVLSEKMDLMKRLSHLEHQKQKVDKIVRSYSTLQDEAKPEEILLLKKRLRDLKDMVNTLEGQGSQQQVKPQHSSKRASQLSATDHLLVEMQEQLKLQKELHLRRKELEELMRKDLLESIRKNENEQLRQQNMSDSKSDISSTQTGWFTDPPNLLPANHYQARSRQISLSSGRSQRSNLAATTTEEEEEEMQQQRRRDKQLQSLQAQVENMHCEIRRLNSSVAAAPSSSSATMFHGRDSGESQLALCYHQQQQQIQQLSQSVNQCLQALLSVQRDISCLHRAMEKLVRLQSESDGSPANVSRAPEGMELQNPGFNPWQVSDMNFGASMSPGAFEAAADPWLQSNDVVWSYSGVNSLSHLNEAPTPGMASAAAAAALNNQVPPGIPARNLNNYWDSFRSISRQNTLSNSASVPSTTFQQCLPSLSSTISAPPAVVISSSSSASAAPNVAQVTPRQLLQSTPNSLMTETAPQPPRARQVSIEPIFNSPPRPRRKQKINREQNRAAAGEDGYPRPPATTADRRKVEQHFAAAAAMVFPMPQNQDRNVNMDTAATNLATVSPIASSLTRSIYNQVNNLISQHEERPEQLARIFQNLQSLDDRLVSTGGSRNNSDATESAHYGNSMSARFTPQAEVPNNTAFKLRTDKRFAFWKAEDQESEEAEGSRLFTTGRVAAPAQAAQNRAEQFPSIRNSFAQPDDGFLGARGGSAVEGAEKSLTTGSNRDSGAVPKNVQRNLKAQQQQSPEEESGSRTMMYMREMPKNMQEACLPQMDVLSAAAACNAARDFVNVDIGFRRAQHESGQSAQANLDEQRDATEDQEDEEEEGDDEDEEESEIPEADQGHSPEQAQFMEQREVEEKQEGDDNMSAVDAESSNDREFDADVAGAAAAVAPPAGDDASASLLEQQMREEEANMISLVDEVLLDDSSPDSTEEVHKPPA